MPHPTARIALLMALLAPLPAAAPARTDDGPAGQFVPSLEDRDGDGLLDAADCAPDDPTRPARPDADLDCDGVPDGGGFSGVGIAGPVDGTDPGTPDGSAGEQTAASRPSTGTSETRTAARRAYGAGVTAVTGLRLGPSVAVYAPARPARTAPTLIFVAKGNSGITVEPSIVYTGGVVEDLRTRTRSVARGRAWVVRVGLTGDRRRARRARLSVTVVDGAGESYAAVRGVALTSR